MRKFKERKKTHCLAVTLLFLGTILSTKTSDAQDNPQIEELRSKLKAQAQVHRQNIDNVRDRVEYVNKGVVLGDNLQQRPIEFGNYRLKNASRLFELLRDDSVIDEIGLSERQGKDIKNRAIRISKNERKKIREFGHSGDIGVIEQLETDCADFHQFVFDSLTGMEKERLKEVLIRRELFSEGIPKFLRKNHEVLGLRLSDVSAIEEELVQACIRISLEANSDFVSLVDEWLPGFVSEMGDDEIEKLPLMPFTALLSLMNDPKYMKGVARYCLSQYEVNLQDGKWLFAGAVFDVDPLMRLRVSPLSRRKLLPIPPFRILHDHSNLDLVDDQERTLVEILEENMSKPKLVDDTGLSRMEVKKKIFDLSTSQLDRVLDGLLPEQVQAVGNYVKLHAIFTLGPEFVSGEFEEAGSLVPNDQLQERIRKLTKKYSEEFVAQVIKLVAEKARDEKISLNESHFYSASDEFRHYEVLLSPFLSARAKSKSDWRSEK